jgi:hypothetical protein
MTGSHCTACIQRQYAENQTDIDRRKPLDAEAVISLIVLVLAFVYIAEHNEC